MVKIKKVVRTFGQQKTLKSVAITGFYRTAVLSELFAEYIRLIKTCVCKSKNYQ